MRVVMRLTKCRNRCHIYPGCWSVGLLWQWMFQCFSQLIVLVSIHPSLIRGKKGYSHNIFVILLADQHHCFHSLRKNKV